MNSTTTLTPSWVRQQIPPRPYDAHKGSSGHVLIIAGSRGMTGAASLCVLGALCSGAGLVTAALPTAERFSLTAQIPEALTLLLPDDDSGHWTNDAIAVCDRYLSDHNVSTIAIGPGLSRRPVVHSLVLHALGQWTQPLVLDADALNSIEAGDLEGHSNVIVTPHPGEFARLFKVSAEEVKTRRSALAQTMAKTFGILCVLKGHETVVSDGKEIRLNPTGNAAMATGGMGDVLSGVIASFLGQGLAPFAAASVGAYLHGLAGDEAAVSDRGLLASELARHLPHALRKIGIS